MRKRRGFSGIVSMFATGLIAGLFAGIFGPNPNNTSDVRAAQCVDNAGPNGDGGVASLYCMGVDTSGNLNFSSGSGATGNVNLAAQVPITNDGPLESLSGVNGAAPANKLTHCEEGDYVISSSTTAAHDAGFFAPFVSSVPTGCTLGIESGTAAGSTAQNISANGLTVTQGSSSTVTYRFRCCGQ